MTTAYLLIPFVAGVVIPFLTAWISAQGWSEQYETLANLVLSAAASSIVTVTFDGNWQHFLFAFVVAWLTTLRSLGTQLPQKVYAKPANGRHEQVVDPPS